MFWAHKIDGLGHARVMLKILTKNLFYKYSMNIHYLQKMLVTNLVLATKCYKVSCTSHQRILGTLLQQDMMQNML